MPPRIPSSRDRFSHFEAILKSVRTPLGFITFVCLLLDSILVLTAAITNRVPLQYPLLLLAFVVLMFFLIVWFRPYALYHPSEIQNATINLILPPDEIDIDFEVSQCRFEVRDQQGQVKFHGTPNLNFGLSGSWTFTLVEIVAPADSVRIVLVDTRGRKWKGRPFAPYHSKHELALDA